MKRNVQVVIQGPRWASRFNYPPYKAQSTTRTNRRAAAARRTRPTTCVHLQLLVIPPLQPIPLSVAPSVKLRSKAEGPAPATPAPPPRSPVRPRRAAIDHRKSCAPRQSQKRAWRWSGLQAVAADSGGGGTSDIRPCVGRRTSGLRTSARHGDRILPTQPTPLRVGHGVAVETELLHLRDAWVLVEPVDIALCDLHRRDVGSPRSGWPPRPAS